VIPEEKEQILARLHSSHIGVKSCIRRARETCYFPGLCARIQTELQKEPLLSHEAPSRPREKLGVDIFNFRGQDYCILVDYLTNYFEIDRLQSKRITDIIYILKQHFARMGIPFLVFSDNNPFNSQEFRNFADRYGFDHQTSSPRYAQSNGKAENAVKQLKD